MAGSSFGRGGVRIAYEDRRPDEGPEGTTEAEPIVLVHGFASSRANNWRDQGWYETLLEAGRRVIALDCRGHGESDKPRDPEAYASPAMAEDVIALLDHLGVERADLAGYSMGGRIGLELLAGHEERFESAVLAGIGSTVHADLDAGDVIVAGLEADDAGEVTNPIGRRFRLFAEENDNDLAALAAVIRSRDEVPDRDALAGIELPVLVVAGSEDDLVGDPEELASAFPDGRAVVVPDRDHITAVPDQLFKDAVVDFLAEKGL